MEGFGEAWIHDTWGGRPHLLPCFRASAPHPLPLGLHPQQAAQKSASVTPGLSQRRALLLNILPLQRGGGGGEGGLVYLEIQPLAPTPTPLTGQLTGQLCPRD